MVFSFFRSTPTPTPTPTEPIPDASPSPISTATATATATEPQLPNPTQPSAEQKKDKNDNNDLPKLWTPKTNTKLLLGGALFFTLSLLTTRRAMTRRFNAGIPPYYTSSVYHKPKVNGGAEAFEALHLATINVLSFAMMATGGVLYAMDINGLDDMRAYVRKRMLSGQEELTESDQELEKEVEDWIRRYLGKRVENGKLKDLNENGSGSKE